MVDFYCEWGDIPVVWEGPGRRSPAFQEGVEQAKVQSPDHPRVIRLVELFVDVVTMNGLRGRDAHQKKIKCGGGLLAGYRI